MKMDWRMVFSGSGLSISRPGAFLCAFHARHVYMLQAMVMVRGMLSAGQSCPSWLPQEFCLCCYVIYSERREQRKKRSYIYIWYMVANECYCIQMPVTMLLCYIYILYIWCIF